jgi:hypothetical protein
MGQRLRKFYINVSTVVLKKIKIIFLSGHGAKAKKLTLTKKKK